MAGRLPLPTLTLLLPVALALGLVEVAVNVAVVVAEAPGVVGWGREVVASSGLCGTGGAAGSDADRGMV